MNLPGSSKSAYFLAEVSKKIETHTLSVVVDNLPGVLARVVGLFSGRGYNIESLTVSEVEHEKHISRITIVTTGTRAVIDQIRHQLGRLVPVHRVVDLTEVGDAIERELALVKIISSGEMRAEILRIAQAIGARTVDVTLESFVFEFSGAPPEIDRFINLMAKMGTVDVARTGLAAIARGAEAI